MEIRRSERKDLIEAFKSRANEWDSYDFDASWDYSTEAGILADIALAVFEKAHTPAEVRGRSRGKHTDAQMLYMICLALEEGIEGGANIDLPDLIVKMISEHWGTADGDTSPEEAEAALAQLAPHIPDHMRTLEPQGDSLTDVEEDPRAGQDFDWGSSDLDGR